MSVVIALSGGIDSVVLTSYMQSKEAGKIRCIYVDFNKKCSYAEISAVKKMCLDGNIPLEIVDASGLSKMQFGYASRYHISRDELDVKDYEDIITSKSPSGFTVLLSLALYYAYLIGYDTLCLGVIKEQYEAREDLQKSLDATADAASLLNKTFSSVKLEVPFSTMYKHEVVKLGSELNADLGSSWSCTTTSEVHCGKCDQCLSRQKAFRLAGVPDPTEYQVDNS